jgi:Cation/multidrug efflux pump
MNHRPVSEEYQTSLSNNLWQAVLIVLIIMFILLGWREALIISVLIPVSFLITIIVLDAISIPIHQISLVSLIIALGMLVDNGIVMTESISAYIRQGFDRIDAAVRSAKELSIPF